MKTLKSVNKTICLGRGELWLNRCIYKNLRCRESNPLSTFHISNNVDNSYYAFQIKCENSIFYSLFIKRILKNKVSFADLFLKVMLLRGSKKIFHFYYENLTQNYLHFYT